MNDSQRERKRARDRLYAAAHREEAQAKAQAWREANRERHREYSNDYHATNRDESNAKRRARRHRDLDRERAVGRAYRAAHRLESAERTRRWISINGERFKEATARYRRAHPAMQAERARRRRVQKAGILLVIRIESDHCGVCLGPLDRDAKQPHALATSIGHEPPLAVAAREGWTVIVERPEHLGCNRRKSDRIDAALGHTATWLVELTQSMIASLARPAAPDLYE